MGGCQFQAMTIVALSSGQGRAGVAVIRISGSRAPEVLEEVVGFLPVPRLATRATVRDPKSFVTIDEGLVLWFPGPASYTGEDVAELHVHGGLAVVEAVMAALCGMNGVRLAEPGEFTRRAFLGGKLDLIQAEGIADLIDAETEGQRQQALAQLAGSSSNLYESWRLQLVNALAYLEAEIDFPDEELPVGLVPSVRKKVSTLLVELKKHLADNRRGERLRDGVFVVIAGPPNVGKSSLLNALAQRDAAIVSSRSGTTRDVVEVRLNLGGSPVILADTAGLHDSEDEVEAEGIRRALQRAEAADLKIVMVEAAEQIVVTPQVRTLIDTNTLVVINKIDIQPMVVGLKVEQCEPWPISVVTGAGLDSFLVALEKKVAGMFGHHEAPVITRARHRTAMEDCVSCLGRFMAFTEDIDMSNGRIELVAEDLRMAVRSLGRITGKVDIEELLDIVFRDFCIGK